MATVNKNFRVKNGLVVEGQVATVNGQNILTETGSDNYIINLISGTATSANTANTVVKRDGSGNFSAGTITATFSGNLTGNVTGNVTGTVSDISNHNTDDLSEGTTNKYFTDNRAKDAAGYILENATQTNVVISYDEITHQLTVTAENGVADSDTDDLTEGTTNLYFTNARAVTALEAVTPDFPAVEIASVAKQVAAEASVATASTNTAVSWAKADYRSAEFLVKIAEGSHTEVSKVILTLDTSDNVAVTEYAMVGTNGSLGSVSADVSGSDVRLRVITDNNNSTVSVVGTLLV